MKGGQGARFFVSRQRKDSDSFVDLQQNYFSVFGLEPSWDISAADVQQRYRQLQQEVHPDRFAGEGERAQRQAAQASAFVNQAFETLSVPVLRAAYLLELAGFSGALDEHTFTDVEFLMQQMQLREQLSELAELAGEEAIESALDGLYKDIDVAEQQQAEAFLAQYQAADYAAAREQVAKMQFLRKLRSEAEAQESALLDY